MWDIVDLPLDIRVTLWDGRNKLTIECSIDYLRLLFWNTESVHFMDIEIM